ncbi:MAG TPA: aminotransferase class I/II-fold pyridoxal phosphate-dependent enzyme [Candidatus Kapabacteria bacterium]|jgi:alanine-synthesizing transaminase|nr:aminotransferase class I/II-fold pyridoxal phosphate-dependent enzyme [Candidatus Kapabacteria bacterium]HOV91573.1 aminotransferase class I/II-fold pyridoxal phosphate-dependent enzyme [Candidatus Kapabacteria bacterium]
MNKSIIPARRTENVTYAIRDITVLANQVKKTGKQMYYLNIGDPNAYDFVTPTEIIESVHKAMLENKNGYADSMGEPFALDAIRYDAGKKGIKNILDAFITTGASEAIELCISALVNQGENFLMPTPGYPLYTAVQAKYELEPNPYYLDESNGWQPDINDIKSKINSKTRAIILINPNNPTGSVCKEETLRQIIDLAIEHNLVIFADEIYDKLLFDGKKLISIASLNDQVPIITFSGLSKNFLAPGFRIGWGVISGNYEILKDYINAIHKLLRARVSANHPLQYAIPTALLGKQEHLKDVIARLEHRRNLTMEHLATQPGISLVSPEGAFYAFPSIEVEDDNHFCSELLKETGVVVVPGNGFGERPASHHFRIVILPPEETLLSAFKIIGEFYSIYKQKY